MARTLSLALRAASVKVSSLWTNRSAWTQHSACSLTLNWPASSEDDHRILKEAMGGDGAPQGALGGEHHRVGMDLEAGDAQGVEMSIPRRLIGAATGKMGRQHGDDRAGQIAPAHRAEGLVVEDVIAMAGAQQAEEVGPA